VLGITSDRSEIRNRKDATTWWMFKT
jgi:hypothetical protein